MAVREVAAVSQALDLFDTPTLSRGLLGTALLLEAIGRQERSPHWFLSAHAHLQEAVSAVFDGDRTIGAGLFSGLAGFGFVLNLIGGTHAHRDLVTSLDETMEPAIRRIATLLADQDAIDGHLLDLISGVVGIGASLSLRSDVTGDVGAGAGQLHSVAELIAKSLRLRDDKPQAFASPAARLDPVLAQRCPHGFINCGMAHGLPGVLAVAATLPLNTGGKLALAPLARWLVAIRHQLGFWPDVLPLLPLQNDWAMDFAQLRRTGPTWCYGSAGICRALMLAAMTMKDDELYSVALEILLSETQAALNGRLPAETGLCHGRAGLLQVLLRTLQETSDDRLQHPIRMVLHSVLDEFDPNSSFGYFNPTTSRSEPGLLTGASGVALALLSVTSCDLMQWDRALLIS